MTLELPKRTTYCIVLTPQKFHATLPEAFAQGTAMPIPPLEFLFDASKRSLEDAELTELNRSSNFAKAMRVEMDAWVEACAAAMVTRWMMENREALLSHREVRAEPKKATKLFGEGKSKSA